MSSTLKLWIDLGKVLLVCDNIQLKKRTIDKLKTIFIFDIYKISADRFASINLFNLGLKSISVPDFTEHFPL